MPGMIAAMIGSSIIGAASSAASTNASVKASDKATAAQTEQAQASLDLQKEIFETTRDDQQPWREAGAQALDQIQQGVADGSFSMENWQYTEDPGYQFRKAEAQKALDQSAAARGGLFSGGHAKNVLKYNQEMASNEYANAYNREAQTRAGNYNILAATAGIGQTANAQVAQAGQNYVNSSTGTRAGLGNAIATGAYNTGQAQANMYNNIGATAQQGVQNYLLYDMLGA